MKIANNIVLIFDLDFTLIDNREGIINSFNHALEKYKVREVSQDRIEKMIGTPLNSMFAEVSNLDPSLLTSAFREYYGFKGIYQVELFSGVKDKLEKFSKYGFVLGVITSKKQEMAIKLLKYLEIDNYFNFIIGETEEFKSKSDYKIRDYLFNKYQGYKFVVIGDHPSDKKLAEMLECPFIGVLTGYHLAEQLKKDAKTNIIIQNSIKEITPELLYSLF